MAQHDGENIGTSALLNRLFQATDLKGFIDKNEETFQTTPFHIYLSELCKKISCVPEYVIRQSSIERTYGHQIFNGTRKPSRDKVIQLAFGIGTDVDGTQELLRAAQKSALYPRIKRDAAVLYCIDHHKSIAETQDMLSDLGLMLLGGDC